MPIKPQNIVFLLYPWLPPAFCSGDNEKQSEHMTYNFTEGAVFSSISQNLTTFFWHLEGGFCNIGLQNYC